MAVHQHHWRSARRMSAAPLQHHRALMRPLLRQLTAPPLFAANNFSFHVWELLICLAVVGGEALESLIRRISLFDEEL